MTRNALVFVALAGASLLADPAPARAQAAGKVLFTDALPPSEFAARRRKVAEKIGPDAVAIISGATEQPNYGKFEQNKQFFYLSGVEVERAILLIDGATRTSTLFIEPRTARMLASEGPELAPGADAAGVTGIEAVVARSTFSDAVAKVAAAGRTLYVPYREESIGPVATDRVIAHERAMQADPWDGRLSKEAMFKEKLEQAAPGSDVADLDPILDEMRRIKSPAEISLIREATRIACEGVRRAIRAARPGMHEYELEAEADYAFKKNNAMGPAYFALVATGTNAAWPHYHQAQSKLGDGELVLMDYAPEYEYYTADISRMFPANGKFSPRQREMYDIYLQLYRALMSEIGPGPAAPKLRAAHEKMVGVLGTFHFTDDAIERAARDFVTQFENPTRNAFGHQVGLEVHDVAGDYAGVYEPGMVFTIEPAFRIPAERVYIRNEDMFVITPTGYENLSKDLPEDIAGIEALMKEGKGR